MQFEKNNSKLFSDVQIPDLFITEYLPQLNADAVRVYLYLLFLTKADVTITPLDLSKRIGTTLDSIKASFAKLEELELITKKIGGYILNDIREVELNKLYAPRLTSSMENALKDSKKNTDRLKAITAINNAYFQGVMSPSWYTDIDMLFTKYNFSDEVMFALFKYCFDRSKLHKAYVKSVATAWNLNKIETHEDLEKYYINYEKCHEYKKKIAKKLGITRQLTQYEEAYIEKWCVDYKFTMDVIEIALKKTTSKSNLSFDYLDKILSDWSEKNLKTVEDVQKHQEDFNKKNTLAKTNKNTKTTATTSAKSGFKQRTYDDLNQFYDNLK